jgi:hypothetical protein
MPEPTQKGASTPPSRRSGGMIAGAVVAGLLLLGAGVGVGAAIWSGGTDTRTVTVSPQANAADDSNPSADENNPPADDTNPPADDSNPPNTGNFAQVATVHVEFPGKQQTVPMKLSQGQPTNCTKDETYGSFAMANKATKPISMWVKMDKDEGRCYTQMHVNTWNVDLPGTSGQLWMRTDIHNVAPFTRYQKGECRGWPGPGIGWSCRADVDQRSPGGHVDFYLTNDG